MARLLADGLVRRESPLGSKERFSFQAPELTEELQQLDRDVDTVCFAEFTEEEIRQYRILEESRSETSQSHQYILRRGPACRK